MKQKISTSVIKKVCSDEVIKQKVKDENNAAFFPKNLSDNLNDMIAET